MLKQLDLNGTWRARWSDGMRGRVEYANRVETDEVRFIGNRNPRRRAVRKSQGVT